MQPLEDIIQSRLIPAWTGRAPPNPTELDLFTLPARLGELGIVNPPTLPLLKRTLQLYQDIHTSHWLNLEKEFQLPVGCPKAQLSSKQAICKEKQGVSNVLTRKVIGFHIYIWISVSLGISLSLIVQ